MKRNDCYQLKLEQKRNRTISFRFLFVCAAKKNDSTGDVDKVNKRFLAKELYAILHTTALTSISFTHPTSDPIPAHTKNERKGKKTQRETIHAEAFK